MLIRPGQLGVTTNFTYTLGGILTVADVAVATVLRNGVDTVVPVALTSVAVGRYQASFDVPAAWVNYDRVAVRFEGSSGGMSIECTKPLAVVGELGLTAQQDLDLARVLALMEADEVRSGNTLYKLAAGTNTILLEKDLNGSTCAADVSITQP